MQYIEMIHSPSYIQRVKREITNGVEYLDSMDTAVCRDSFDIALKAVGGSLSMCDAIMDGLANGFCAIRPPGHHAKKKTALAGFVYSQYCYRSKISSEQAESEGLQLSTGMSIMVMGLSTRLKATIPSSISASTNTRTITRDQDLRQKPESVQVMVLR